MTNRFPSYPLGRYLFAVAIAAFGIESILCSDVLSELEPLPAFATNHFALGYVSGALLIGAAACLVPRRIAPWGAKFAAIILAFWVLFLQVPQLLGAPHSGGAWTSLFETLGLAGAAVVLTGLVSAPTTRPERRILIETGRYAFAAALLAFGVLHFIYHAYVASVIPAWIPSHVFWAYFTGVAFIAAGMSLFARRLSLLAATLVGIMFATWVLVLHVPRVAAAAHDRGEWTSLLVALAMSGGAFIVAKSFEPNESLSGRLSGRM